MKTKTLILAALVLLPSCGGTPQAVTKHADGSTTSVPVAEPRDVLHSEMCKATLNTQF